MGNDHIWVSVDDLAEEVGIAFGPPLTGIPFDGEVLSLDIAQPAQLLPKRVPQVTSRVVDTRDRTSANDDRDPVLLRRPLRPHRLRRYRKQQTDCEIAPPHSITSWAIAPARSVGGDRLTRPPPGACFVRPHPEQDTAKDIVPQPRRVFQRLLNWFMRFEFTTRRHTMLRHAMPHHAPLHRAPQRSVLRTISVIT